MIFLGAASYLVPSIAALERADFRVVSVDRDPAAPGHRIATRALGAGIDDVDAIAAAIAVEDAVAVIPGIEAGVVAAALASERAGIGGIGLDVALRCTDKLLMRTRWRTAGLRQPDFMQIARASELALAIEAFGLPLVVKPARLGGSRGVSVVLVPDDIEAAVADAVAVGGGGEFIVERFIPGPLLTADGFVGCDEVELAAVGDVETAAANRFRVNMSLNYPAAYPSHTIAEAQHLIRGAVHALGLQHSAFHCECIVGPDAVYLVELAARGGGSFISSTIVEAVGGLCAPVVFAQLLAGDAPAIRPTQRGGATLRFLAVPGRRFAGVSGLAAAAALPGIVDIGVDLQLGSLVGAITHDNARHGHIVAVGATRDEAVARAAAAERCLIYR